jgi:aquaporin Z
VASQIVGGCLASGVVHLLFPLDATLGATRPSGTVGQAWALEVVLTAILMYLILAVSSGSREKGITAGLAIGGMVTLEALLGTPDAFDARIQASFLRHVVDAAKQRFGHTCPAARVVP